MCVRVGGGGDSRVHVFSAWLGIEKAEGRGYYENKIKVIERNYNTHDSRVTRCWDSNTFL